MNRRLRVHSERELYRLALAEFDFKSAAIVAEHLNEAPEGIYRALGGGTQASDLYWGLWTGLVVSYARPFTDSRVGRISAKRFERFDEDGMARHHRFLLQARKAVFAHNDLTEIRAVTILPPGAWGEEVPGRATVERLSFTREAAERSRELCNLQHGRAGERIVELVEELCGSDIWDDGALLDLKYPASGAADPSREREAG